MADVVSMIGEIKCDKCKKVWIVGGEIRKAMEDCQIWNHNCFKKSKFKTDLKKEKKNDKK